MTLRRCNCTASFPRRGCDVDAKGIEDLDTYETLDVWDHVELKFRKEMSPIGE